MAKTIRMVFEWDGKTVHEEAKGFKGKECKAALDALAKAMGRVESMTLKSEYSQEEDAKPKILGIKIQ